jgi:hypothetical protein
MADFKKKYDTEASLTITLNSLASGALVASSAFDNTTSLYVDLLVEFVIANISEAGNKQVLIYAASSLDGTNFSEAVSSNRQQMAYVGAVSVNGTGPHRSRALSVAAAFGGVLPPEFQIVAYNDAGIALASSGNSAQYRGVWYQSV